MRQYKKKTRLVAALLTGLVLCGTPAYIGAEDEDLTNQLDQIQQQVNDQNTKKVDAETVIGSVSEQLRQIEEQLRQASAELGVIQQQRVAVENDITINERQLQEAQKRLEGREAVFYKRVRDIYINGRLSYLDVVIGSKDFNDFANRLEVLRRIINSDINLINEIKKERADIEARKQQLEANRVKLVEIEKAVIAKQSEIEQKKAERNEVLQRAQNDRATAMQAIEELNASSAQVTALLKERQAARAAAAAAAAAEQAQSYTWVQGSGQLGWPASGEITSPFGYRTHPIWGTTIYHAGIDIGVDEGVPVHAADGGTVVWSGWMGGYGYAVVIDHGNGLSTLYGHNSELVVSEGEAVGKGQVIAYAGSTGNSTGPHVHFEVRVNGDPVDPMGYL
ncbi:murein hydrolase activator EnvC [Veillonella caviae]|uniref:murein hydrolase activator EnvC family protein n=1 Tax=Veillonella caviae TaxID=248316 RepID=UPI000F8E2F60|nr:M23 family metallopeptidase [Veillonella caviae]MCF0158202.1 peptidoglycan DD-metalloendopeptidase family protein [Veillonella sp.]MCI5708495.1 peptidoglycan DD-metalloendopeptidase family protein [Veillonella caviae]MCI6407577.1 peptidoglycan DD-metalloendopeptidase family protein [Veillonella caviae]MCI7693914.1 peptidoglycan DD-metalloendopeptidase family protein [Veillonella caviae]MDD7290655.1 peptidoglycan DD-metalloendopeptidase family protein [Veillonella caviae]